MPIWSCNSIFILNNSAIWLENMKPQNKQMHCRISPGRTCNPCGYTMKISCRYQRLLIYDVKIRTTKIDGLGPFKHCSDKCSTLHLSLALTYGTVKIEIQEDWKLS